MSKKIFQLVFLIICLWIIIYSCRKAEAYCDNSRETGFVASGTVYVDNPDEYPGLGWVL